MKKKLTKKFTAGRFDKAASQTNALAQKLMDKQIPMRALDTFFRTGIDAVKKNKLDIN
jgi:hypothetical protein